MTKIKVAIIGCGVVARKHLKAILFHHKTLQLCAVVDQRQDAAQTLLAISGLTAQAQEAVRFYSDTATMLATEKPQLTAITTPSGSHFELASLALHADSHVLVEKPLTLDLTEARQLLDLAAAKNLQVAVGHIYRFFPLVQQLEKALRAGTFGQILYGDVKVRWGHDQTYYDQAAWRGTWAADGGALMNQSIHALDLMTWLLGEEVLEVSALIDRQVHEMEAEDLGLAVMKLSHGVYCQLEGTTNTDPARPEASFYICCTKGEIRAGILAGKPRISVRMRDGRKRTGYYLSAFLKTLFKTYGPAGLKTLKNPHTGLYQDMVEAIKHNREPLASGYSGMKAVEQVLAIYESAVTGKKTALPSPDFTLETMQNRFTPPAEKRQ